MQTITLKGNKRESVGKSSTKALRNAGLVPCVVYGGGDKAPIHFAVKTQDLNPLVYTPNVYKVSINLDDKTEISSILQDIQFHPVTDDILHVDFYKLSEDKPVSIEVPVRITGNSVGLIKGGALRTNLRKLKIKALPKNLPDFVGVDITPLDIGDKFYVSELKNDTYDIINPDNTVIVQVKMSRTASKSAEQDSKSNK